MAKLDYQRHHIQSKLKHKLLATNVRESLDLVICSRNTYPEWRLQFLVATWKKTDFFCLLAVHVTGKFFYPAEAAFLPQHIFRLPVETKDQLSRNSHTLRAGLRLLRHPSLRTQHLLCCPLPQLWDSNCVTQTPSCK